MVEIIGGVELVGFSQGKLARGKIGGAADDLRARRLLQPPGGGRMVAVGVGGEDFCYFFAGQRREQGRDMGGVVRAGIDDRDFALADDIDAGAGEGEGAGIGGDHPPHQP